MDRPTWYVLMLTYPCPTCHADVGQECVTKAGRRAFPPHVGRTNLGNRCPKCLNLLALGSDPGSLCARCQLVRDLEVERARRYVPRPDS